MIKSKIFLAALGASLCCAIVAPVHAASVVFVQTATGSGTLGGVSFADALVTLSATGDTDDVTFINLGGFPLYIENLVLTINVDGVGTAEFTGAMRVFSRADDAIVGFQSSDGLDLLDTRSGDFTDTHDLMSDFTLIGDPLFNAGTAFDTTVGIFQFDSISGSSTFTETLGQAAVFEPATWAMMLIGFGFVGSAMRARSRKQVVSVSYA